VVEIIALKRRKQIQPNEGGKSMNKSRQKFWPSLAAVFAVALMISAGCSTTARGANEGLKVKLTGDQEVPPVKTAASGTGTIVISSDKSVSGSITTIGVEATAAHIHEGPAGKNGPVIIPFTKGPDNTWSPAPGAKLTDAQYASYQAGNLYVNVHSAANKGGEIRAQLNPKQ
jgi:CHRD domain-containing protein